jgi:hypothetical protein
MESPESNPSPAKAAGLGTPRSKATPHATPQHGEVFNLSEWRDHIEQQGFAVIQGVLQRSEVATLLLDLSDLYRRPSRAGLRHILSHSAINSVANDGRLLGIAQSILGGSAFPFRATLFNKSPDSNWLIAWH